MHAYLDFEKPIAELEGKIVELRQLADADPTMQIDGDVARLQSKADALVRDTYAKLTPWQKVQVARHQNRPHFSDYVNHLIDEFTPLAGDRLFGEDAAVIAGLGRFRGRAVAVVGQEKGNDTKSRLKHNFGMAMPEGYRKAQRLFDMADRFGLPVLSLVDTSGAYPGVSAEERGQSEAIARSTQAGLELRVPFICTIIGDGMSGGAIAIAAANRVYMLEHAIYSVISPEGCAAILWRDRDAARQAAAAFKPDAEHTLELGVIDGIVAEPPGGAQTDPDEAARLLRSALVENLEALAALDAVELRRRRRAKFRSMGFFA
jgi:acetyl-CoA carboxylase carboxyl transferase subunit alpha